MSILKVDTINEKTSGNGVAIPGHVIQVIQTTGTTQTELTTTGTWTDVVPTATITPKFSTSKILVIHSAGGMGYATTSGSMGMRILRGSTNIASRSRQAYLTNNSSKYSQVSWDMNFLDSPATTSAITYKVQIYLEMAGNIRHNSQDSNISPITSLSTTTLMEIAQ